MLRAAGVHTVVVRKPTSPGANLVFLFNASHKIDEVDQAANALASAADNSLARRRVKAATKGSRLKAPTDLFVLKGPGRV